MINGYASVIMADVAAGNSLVQVINKVSQSHQLQLRTLACCNQEPLLFWLSPNFAWTMVDDAKVPQCKNAADPVLGRASFSFVGAAAPRAAARTRHHC